ncbi:MAG: hypothetical protein WBW04_20265 [Nitrolancea sp.]
MDHRRFLLLFILLSAPWMLLLEVLPISAARRYGLWFLFALWAALLAAVLAMPL